MNDMSPTEGHKAAGARSRGVSQDVPGVENARRVSPVEGELFIPLLENEPPRLSPSEFRQMLMSAVMSGGSDITIQSDQQPRVEIGTTLHRGMRRPLDGKSRSWRS